MQIRKFWWGSEKDEHKGMMWKSWKYLCHPKKQGGIGFRDLHAFNLALVAKQAWRVITKPKSLLSRVLKAKYFLRTDPMKLPAKPGISYMWCSLLQGIRLVKTRSSLASG